MNYDHINQVHDFAEKEYRPLLRNLYLTPSFAEYLKKCSYTKTLNWIRDMDAVNFARPTIALDPIPFATKYGNKCVSFYQPAKPEEGVFRAIYQFSHTLHIETILYAWVENNALNTYLTLLACYKDAPEYLQFIEDIRQMRRTGNTEQREGTGFARGTDQQLREMMMGIKSS